MLALVRLQKQLAVFSSQGRLSPYTWRKFKRAAGVPKHAVRCSLEHGIKLCAAVCLHLDGKRVSPLAIDLFLRQHGRDPRKFLSTALNFEAVAVHTPGMTGSDMPENYSHHFGQVINPCYGHQLPQRLKPLLIKTYSRWSISRWCTACGFVYSKDAEYTKEQIEALALHRLRLDTKEIQKGKNLWRYKHEKKYGTVSVA